MKKNLLFLSIVFLMPLMQISNYCNAQESKEFLNSPDAKVTWLGIDFSQVRLLGDVGATSAELKDRYFIAINDVVVNETEKYNITINGNLNKLKQKLRCIL